MTTRSKRSAKSSGVEALLGQDGEMLRRLMQEALQQVQEAEMTEHIGLPHHIEARRRVAFGVQNPKGLQDGRLVGGPRLILRQGQAHAQEPPGGPDLVVSLRHVAGVASGRRRFVRQRAVLLEKVPDAVLGRRAQLPLRIVDTHAPSARPGPTA